MNCKTFRKQIDIAFKNSGYEVNGELLEHANSCARCSDYLKELKLLQEALNEPRLEVLPGELNDLTFDKIIAAELTTVKGRRPIRVARALKWILAPAAVGLAAVLIAIFAGRGRNNVDYANIITDSYSSTELENSIMSSDSLSMELLSSLAGNDASLDHAADELLSESDVDDILGSLTPSELKALYEKIDNLKG